MYSHSQCRRTWLATAMVVVILSTARYSSAAELEEGEVININGRHLTGLRKYSCRRDHWHSSALCIQTVYNEHSVLRCTSCTAEMLAVVRATHVHMATATSISCRHVFCPTLYLNTKHQATSMHLGAHLQCCLIHNELRTGSSRSCR
jgi:hypothetical protein